MSDWCRLNVEYCGQAIKDKSDSIISNKRKCSETIILGNRILSLENEDAKFKVRKRKM